MEQIAPVSRGSGRPFTPETSRKYQAIAAESRRLATGNSFQKRTLLRVRVRVMALLQSLESESDAQRIDRLCSGLGKLCEIERQLAGRPLPGSLKPKADKPARASSIVEPI